MNLPFLTSSIAPLEQQQAEALDDLTMKALPSSKSKRIPAQRMKMPLDQQAVGGTRTPDSVTMYPASFPARQASFKKMEERSVSVPTKSIPITKNIKRTPSELQLMEDEAVADFRDYCMYTRIVSGITGARHHPADLTAINNIVRTRHLPVQDPTSSYVEQNSRYAMMVPSLVESACRITDESSSGHGADDDGYDLFFPPPVEDNDDSEEGVFVMDL